MTKFYLNLFFIFIVLLSGASVVDCQTVLKKVISLNPPKWILGAWSNSAESDFRKMETFLFFADNINFSRFIESEPRTVKPETVVFTEKFKDYEVKETIEPKLYRIIFTKDANQYTYEFKICEDCYVSFAEDTALTYCTTENKKDLCEHSSSINLVLFKGNN